MKKGNIKFILLIILFVLIDFISKLLVTCFLKTNSLVLINNFLKLELLKNYGAAFGILNGELALLIIITIIFIYYIIKELKNNKNNKLTLFSYGLILSGAIGNLIDRVFRKYVVDFISFTLFGRQMAVFNIADSYITIGVILLFISMIKENIWKK